MRDETRTVVGRAAIGEEELAFIPVTNTGKTAFSLALDPTGQVLILHTAKNTFKIQLQIKED